jgi:hypothetical protein
MSRSKGYRTVSRLVVGLALLTILFSPRANAEDEPDPHRPACTTAQCRKIRKFVQSHYCGEAEGNGPDDSCQILPPQEQPKVQAIARYECEWTDGVRNCRQHGTPSAEVRRALVDRLRQLGLPANAKGKIYYNVWQAGTSDWFLVEAYYDRLAKYRQELCQVIAVIDSKSQVTVLRKVRFQKVDAEKNFVTTWSLLDLADTNSDGQIDVVLEGDSYENHWVEVLTVRNGTWRTVFSGLGYWL